MVPNGIIAKARLVNRSSPTPVRGSAVSIGLDCASPPERCRRRLLAAARTCRVMLSEPAASIHGTELAGQGAVWEVSASRSRPATAWRRPGPSCSARSQRHLRHAGIALAVPGGAAVPVAVPTLAELPAESDLFGIMTAADRALLIPYFAPDRLEPGGVLMRQGEAPHGLSLLASGTVEIAQDTPAGPRMLERLSSRETLGAIGLITGTAHAATATALTELEVFRIGREEIGLAIRARPELARRGQDALRRDATAAEPVHPEMFLSRLRNLLRVLGS